MNLITNNLKKTWSIMLLDFKKIKEYKTELVSYCFILPFKIFIYTLLWRQIYKVNGNNLIYTETELISYYAILCIIEVITMPFCTVTYEMMEDVKEGNLDIWLIRPTNYFVNKYLSNSSRLLMGLIIIIFFILLNKIPLISFQTLVIIYFYIISSLMIFLLFSLAGLLVFLVENVLTFRDNLWNIIKLMSGAIIPLSFYPEGILRVIRYLPFQYIYDKPITIILSAQSEWNFDIILSFSWLVVLFILLMMLWKSALKHYTSQGG